MTLLLRLISFLIFMLLTPREPGIMYISLTIVQLIVAVAVGLTLPTLFSLFRSYFKKLSNKTKQGQRTEANDLKSPKPESNGKMNKYDKESSKKWTSISGAEDTPSPSSSHSSDMARPEHTTPTDQGIPEDTLFMGPTASTVFSASTADRTTNLRRRYRPSRDIPIITSRRPDGVDLLEWVKTLVDAEMDRKMKEMEVHEEDAA